MDFPNNDRILRRTWMKEEIRWLQGKGNQVLNSLVTRDISTRIPECW